MVTMLDSSAALPINYLLILFSVEYRFLTEQINNVQACQASVKRDRKNKTKFPGGENTPDFSRVCMYIYIHMFIYCLCGVWILSRVRRLSSLLVFSISADSQAHFAAFPLIHLQCLSHFF